jgi:tRNA-(ms[2]io[6]A)-hydroxylase
VAALLGKRGWTPRADSPNRYARALLEEVRGREPERLLDALLVAAFIEARSHERLGILARGFTATGETELGDFYAALGDAEERHAETFLELARPLVDAETFAARLEELGQREAEILGALPHVSRVH